MPLHRQWFPIAMGMVLLVSITANAPRCQGIILTKEGQRLLQELREKKYEVTLGDESVYYVSPEELMGNYHRIRKEGIYIKKYGFSGEKEAIVYLTPDPSNAEVQQLRDRDSAYIYKLQDFNAKLMHRDAAIRPSGETKALESKTVAGKQVRIIERKLYATGETKQTINAGVLHLPWWLPYSPP